MALGFILSGIRKMPGVKFTIYSSEDNIVGLFFTTMEQTGFYWNFIGYYQIVFGFLLLFNRTTVLSALLIMPVTINIFLVSIALNMKGTPIITVLMLLANIFLILWNIKNYKSVFARPIA